MAGTLYDVLGVAPDASAEALRAAHCDRARRLHPDLAPGARCPEGTDGRALRGDQARRTVFVARVAGR